MELIKNVKHGEEFSLRNLVQLEPGRVNSLTLSQTPGCKTLSLRARACRATPPRAMPW